MTVDGESQSTPQRFTKRPVVIEAIQYTGKPLNAYDIGQWAHAGRPPETNAIVLNHVTYLVIRTLEGNMVAQPGDWIIKGVKGEFYPCKPDIFAATYNPEIVLTEADAAADLAGTPRPDHPTI
ncbi:hypothetical protein [Castellaniella denitrificans]|uniref:Uncharacterized protein n=1 Tax=Castellaniella denitrificans TaxID=56119 RepID=A0ABT4M5Z5_9BURK|nr:hypothetical protein [Castellaniella denitrificans]MCZ4330743.1 hypothetical protein [Castellaniella denitrificans]